jgi:thioredoxin 1
MKVVLQFTAPWSEPCKFMRPALEKIASDFKDHADFYTLDVEQFKVRTDIWMIDLID